MSGEAGGFVLPAPTASTPFPLASFRLSSNCGISTIGGGRGVEKLLQKLPCCIHSFWQFTKTGIFKKIGGGRGVDPADPPTASASACSTQLAHHAVFY